MKKLKNILKKLTPIFKKYRWCFGAIFIIILLVIFLYCVGFRITYAPELETSWNAVIAFANWGSVFVSLAGAIASFLAVWFAIKVPKQIADKQNKISLFEKRYKIYNMIAENYALACSIASANDRIDIQRYFLNSYPNIDTEQNIDNRPEITSLCTLLFFEMAQSKFLFDEEMGNSAIHLSLLITAVINASLDKNKTSNLKQAQTILMLEVCNSKYIKMLNKMEPYLKITK